MGSMMKQPLMYVAKASESLLASHFVRSSSKEQSSKLILCEKKQAR